MERKHSRKPGEMGEGNVRFWEICLKFDIACICLLACLIISGMGRGEAVRQNIIATVKMQARTQEGNSQAAGEPQAEKKKVAITFDDGPHPQYTPEMLAGLKERNVKATFFLLGEEVEKYPQLVKQIHEEGHLIGNHSYKHEQLSKLSMEQACAQVSRTNEAIYKLTGIYPSYLRPPFGDWRQELDCKVNMVEVLWDVDTRDWSIQDHAKIVEKALKDVQDNDIILMHDGYETSVTAAMEIVDTLQKQGYEFVTVDEMIFD